MAAPALARTASATSNATTASLTVTVVANAGETLLASISSSQQASSFLYTSATTLANGGSWKRLFTMTNGKTMKLEVWGTPAGGASAATSVVISFTGSCDAVGAIVSAYTGVVDYGLLTTATGTATTGVVNLPTTDVNSLVVGCFTNDTANAASQHTGGSTLDLAAVFGAGVGNDCCGAITHLAAASPFTSVQSIVDFAASLNFCAVAIELRSVANPASYSPATGRAAPQQRAA